MDSKGKVAQAAYPNVVFCVDNFEDIFSQIFASKQGQKVAVQLLATNDVSRGKNIKSGVVWLSPSPSLLPSLSLSECVLEEIGVSWSHWSHHTDGNSWGERTGTQMS